MADDNEKLMETTIIPGRGAIYGKGSSGEGALDYSSGSGSTGAGRGADGETGQSPDSEADLPRMSRDKYGSTGYRAVQAPNRPK